MIIDKLHEKFPYLSDLRMREIRVDRQQRRVYCTLSYPNTPDFDNNVKAQIDEFIKGEVPRGYYASTKFAQDVFTETSFRRNLTDYLKSRYPIFANISKYKIDVGVVGRNITVVFNVSEVIKKNMELSNLCEQLTEHYAEYTCYEVGFFVRIDEGSQGSASVQEQERLVQLAVNRELLKPSRYFSVSNVDKYFGKSIVASPMYIADVRKPTDICVICGTISGKIFRQSKNNPTLYVCNFALTDGTGSTMSCVLFVRLQITDIETIVNETGRGEAESRTLSEKRILANDKKLKELTLLANGMSVIVRGKVVYNRNGQLEMNVYDLCKCKIEPIVSREFTRAVADEYLLVKPQDCSEYVQINFVHQLPDRTLLANRQCVVLHVNATGLSNVVEDKLYAICAVKVSNGHVTEKFFTYINPEKDKLDDKMLAQCNISQGKLIFHPTVTEIISDLYKFTYGCELVGTNLAQIVELLNYYAAPVGYKFNNKLTAQTELLSSLFDNSLLDVNVNLSKLDDVAKKCKVECKNTVFCEDTAMTVARVMSMLSYNSK